MADYIQNLEKVSVSIDGETFEIVAASFRGVPFFVENYSQGGLGRTIATKKIPFSNRFIHEDTGANVPTHTMSIYLVGNDCDTQKQNLIDACGKEGTAEFVHPWLGRFSARVSQLSFNGSRSELGIVKGSITVEQEDDIPARSVSQSMALKTKVDAKAYRTDTKAKFTDRMNALKKAKGTVEREEETTESALDAISDARKSLNEINEFVNEIGQIKANVGIVADTPADFATRIENLLTSTASLFGYETDRKSEVDEYISIMGFVSATETGTLLRNMSAACLVSSLVDAEFASVDEAAEYQDKVLNAFDSMLSVTDSVSDYMALNSLQASALEYLRDNMANMAVVIEKENTATENILTIAFDTYNGIDRIEEIMERNGFPQGLFITPGKVKVLSK